MDIYELMKQVNEWVKEILQDNYVGVYFHGSLRLGSFNPNKSDLDFIIVVKEKINSETKQFIWDKMLENEQLFPKKGFEFSVVLEDNCRNIKHPISSLAQSSCVNPRLFMIICILLVSSLALI